jgi:hypothetical protein|tara:strand:- start:190 stop:477 length:288 start_codon:yes stop_codon:yes gene_type:complete
MMTKGDLKWIENWKPKGVKMKPTKKRPAKRTDNPIISKLLKLKYRINDAYRGGNGNTRDDKNWVMDLINDVRNSNITKLCKEDILHCNGLWRKYE